MIFASRPETARAEDTSPSSKGARVLFVTQSLGFPHTVVHRKEAELSTAERAFVDLGVSKGFRVDCTQDVAKDFTKENLQNYDIVAFYTTGNRNKWPVDDAMLEYFLNDWLKQKGHGFIGIHCATDTLADYQPYMDMICAAFEMHPWDANSEVAVKVHEPENPICKPWGSAFTITDEIYQFKHWQPDKVRVLMSLDLAKTNLDRARVDAQKKHLPIAPFVPIAWCRDYGQGKVLYLSLGHNEAIWTDPRFLQSLVAGIDWMMGREQIDATPNPQLDAAEREKGQAALAAGAQTN